MEPIIGIYAITNTINGKVYVGQSQCIQRRWYAHRWALKHNKASNQHLQCAWNQYGEQAFTFDILEKCLIEQLDAREKYWIEQMGAYSNGYNMNYGGGSNRGYKLPEEALHKIKAALTGKKKTPAAIENSRKALHKYYKEHPFTQCKAVVCLNTGDHFPSAELAALAYCSTAFSIQHACRGTAKTSSGAGDKRWVWRYEEDYVKMSKQEIDDAVVNAYIRKSTVHVITDEHHQKLSQQMRKKYSDPEQREILSKRQREWLATHDNPNARSVICLNTLQVYPSIKDAAEQCNIPNGSISKNCRRKTYSCIAPDKTRTVWMYLDEYQNASAEIIQNRLDGIYHKMKRPAYSEQTKVRIGAASRERWKNDEYRANQIEQHRKYNEIHESAVAKAVQCIDTGEIFKSIQLASNHYHINNWSISLCCRGTRQFAGGMRWQYYTAS